MKFQKGLLTELEKKDHPSEVSIKLSANERTGFRAMRQNAEPETKVVEVEKNRLFETLEETKSSSRKYIAALGIVGVLVLIGLIAGSYFMTPGTGDKILAPKGLEAELREHFLTKQKRDSTDISYYKCEGFVWARVGVETRNDLPNPVFRMPTYSARATADGDSWIITAAPITAPALDIPCN